MTADEPPTYDGGPPPTYEPDQGGRVVPFRRAAQPEIRQLPNDPDAEGSVLGGILISNAVLAKLTDLEVDDFYDPRNKHVFAAMRNLEAAGLPIDMVLVHAELEKRGLADAVGGWARLGEIALRCPAPENVPHYAAIVHGHKVTRDLMLRAGEAIGAAGRGSLDGYDAVTELIGDLQRIEERRRTDIVMAPIAWSIGEQPIAPITVYETPFPELDSRIGGGVSTRSTTIVVARTGAGKSGFVIGTGVHLLRTQRVPFLYCSSELDDDECFARFGAHILNVPHRDVYFGRVRREETTESLRGLNIHILDRRALRHKPVVTIARQVKRLADHYGVAPVTCVDFLQDLIADKDEKSIRAGVSTMAGELRDLGSDLDAVMLMVSSTGRGFYKPPKEGADDPISYLASAKESGDVEYAASNLLFLDVASEHNAGLHRARIVVSKARRGSAGFVGAMFDGPTGRWTPSAESVAALAVGARGAASQDDQQKEEDRKVLARIAARPMRSWNITREECGMSKTAADRARLRLLEAQQIESIEEVYSDAGGRKQKRMVLCVKNAPALPLNIGQTGSEGGGS